MNEIYVVLQSWKDYDDAGSKTILVTPSPEIAEAKVAEMIARKEVRDAAYKKICEHMADWEISVIPRPVHVMFDRNKGFNDRFLEWATKRRAEQLRFTATLPPEETVDLFELNNDFFWDIEPVPYQE